MVENVIPSILKRPGKPHKKWRTRARMVDMHKVKIVLMRSEKPKLTQHVPPWLYEKLLQNMPNSLDLADGSDDCAEPMQRMLPGENRFSASPRMKPE